MSFSHFANFAGHNSAFPPSDSLIDADKDATPNMQEEGVVVLSLTSDDPSRTHSMKISGQPTENPVRISIRERSNQRRL